VGSFAFGRQTVAIDTNARRVFDRAGALAPPPGEAATFNQATMELGARICTARRPRCGECPIAEGCASSGRIAAPPRATGPRTRFEDTDRWVRGRVVAAAASGEALPDGLEKARLERAVAALEREGLIERTPSGGVRLPGPDPSAAIPR
jgi:A/G-specific adenine glycosylase